MVDMFPHTVTILNIEKKDNLIINKAFVDNVLFYDKNIISQDGKGEKYSNTSHCIFSDIALEKYLPYEQYKNEENKNNYFTLKLNDVVIKGKYEEDITNIFDINNISESFYIKTISSYTEFEDMNSIEVTD